MAETVILRIRMLCQPEPEAGGLLLVRGKVLVMRELYPLAALEAVLLVALGALGALLQAQTALREQTAVAVVGRFLQVVPPSARRGPDLSVTYGLTLLMD
jgi:hypothetical protein